MRRAWGGFTLLEVMIGLALLGLALAVLIKSAAGSIFNSQQAHLMGVATDLARGKMYDIEEKLIKDGFADMDQSQLDAKAFEEEGWPEIRYSYKVEAVEMPPWDELQALAKGHAKKSRSKIAGLWAAARRAARRAAAAGTACTGRVGVRLGGTLRLGLRGLGSADNPMTQFQNSALGGMLNMMGGGFGGAGAGLGSASEIGGAQGGALIQAQYTMFQQILKVSVRKVTLTVTYKVLGSDRDLKLVAFFTDPQAMDIVLNGLGAVDLGDGSGSGGAGSGSGSGRQQQDHANAGADGEQMTAARRRRARDRQAGLTLLEIMIASAIMVVMMALAWRTISNASDSRRTFEKYEERNHELRMALGRVVRDFESAYLSRNEDITAGHPRTMLIAKSGSKVPEIRFSTLGHRALWADANESEQTVIWYLAHNDPEHSGQVDLIRREQRRESNMPPEEEASEYDVLVHDISSVKIEFWNWKNLEWVDTWDTTQSDGQRGMLPSRVRITLIVKSPDGKDIKLTTQARVLMQEMLNFSPNDQPSRLATLKDALLRPRYLGAKRPTRRQRRRRQRGIALVMVMIAIAITLVITNEFGTATNVDILAASNYRDQMRAHFLARSAANLGELVIRIQQRLDNIKALRGQVQITDYADQLVLPFCGGPEEVQAAIGFSAGQVKGLGADIGTCGFNGPITTEDDKINVNCANGNDATAAALKSELDALVFFPAYDPVFDDNDAENWHRDRTLQVAAIIDYIDTDTARIGPDGSARGTSEDYGYESLKYHYYAKNNYIDSVGELKLVRGVDDRFWTLFGNSFTVYGSCKINVTAVTSPELIAAILYLSAKNPADPVILDPRRLFTLASYVAKARQFGETFGSLDDFISFVKDPGASVAGLATQGGTIAGQRRERRDRRACRA